MTPTGSVPTGATSRSPVGADSTGRRSLVALVVWGATAVVSVAFVLAAVFVK